MSQCRIPFFSKKKFIIRSDNRGRKAPQCSDYGILSVPEHPNRAQDTTVESQSLEDLQVAFQLRCNHWSRLGAWGLHSPRDPWQRQSHHISCWGRGTFWKQPPSPSAQGEIDPRKDEKMLDSWLRTASTALQIPESKHPHVL